MQGDTPLTRRSLRRARQERREQENAQLRECLVNAKRQLRDEQKHAVGGRATANDLARYLSVALDDDRAIRPAATFRPRGYARDRQIVALVNHLFVRYPTAPVLYRAVLTEEGVEAVFGPGADAIVCPTFTAAFLAAGRGHSVAHVLRKRFTRREVHFFQQAPADMELFGASLWARGAALGTPTAVCDYVARAFQVMPEVAEARLLGLFGFFAANWHALQRSGLRDVTHYLQARMIEADYTFARRSVRAVQNEMRGWTQRRYGATVRPFVSWRQAYAPWERRFGFQLVRAIELTNNRALYAEGAAQCNCAASYEDDCVRNSSRIVSLRWSQVGSAHERRVTIEVHPDRKEVVQAARKHNRPITPDDMEVLRAWAADHGHSISSYV